MMGGAKTINLRLKMADDFVFFLLSTIKRNEE